MARDVSKEFADKLGKREQEKGTKGWDGGDLKDADARLYGLRNAGYKGWINKDGHIA